jgi:hypothetical protein
MAGKGGYQAPSSPAAVSGPGKFSQRTDGGPGSPDLRMQQENYGDSKALADIKGSAPMSSSSGSPPPLPPQSPVPSVTPLGAESERPNEPVTSGSPSGAGPGPSPEAPTPEMEILKRYLPLLQPIVDRPDMPDSVRALYSFIRDG